MLAASHIPSGVYSFPQDLTKDIQTNIIPSLFRAMSSSDLTLDNEQDNDKYSNPKPDLASLVSPKLYDRINAASRSMLNTADLQVSFTLHPKPAPRFHLTQ
jgi:hypothetical protein